MNMIHWLDENGYYSVERYAEYRGLVVAAAKRRFHENDKLLMGHIFPAFYGNDYYYDIAAMKYMDRQIQKHPMKEDEILDMKVYRKKFTQTYEEVQAQKHDSSNCSEMQKVQEENAMLKKENEQLKEEIELLKKIIRNL